MPSVQTASVSCPRTRNRAHPGSLLGLGLFLCALCCSVPLLAGIGIGGAALASMGVHAESVGLVFLGLGVLGFVWKAFRRRRPCSNAR